SLSCRVRANAITEFGVGRVNEQIDRPVLQCCQAHKAGTCVPVDRSVRVANLRALAASTTYNNELRISRTHSLDHLERMIVPANGQEGAAALLEDLPGLIQQIAVRK